MASRIHKRSNNNNYIVYFVNPINADNTQIGTFKKKEDAIELAHKKDIEFYSKHSYLVPSGITFSSYNKRFRLYTRYGYLGSHKTLMEAVEEKQNIINDLTQLKGITRNKSTSLIK